MQQNTTVGSAIDVANEKIEKVYSIWICANPPKKRENTITSYQLKENAIVGDVREKEAVYDLIHVVMICLGNSQDTQQEFLKLLDVLLKDTITVEVKKQRLRDEFHIPMTQEIESEVNVMCNLSDGIEERGIKKGRIQERIEIAREMQIPENILIEQLIKKFGLTIEKATEYIEKR